MKLMKLFLALMLLSSIGASAQIIADPTTWSFEAKKSKTMIMSYVFSVNSSRNGICGVLIRGAMVCWFHQLLPLKKIRIFK
jgi:hypothetical protein